MLLDFAGQGLWSLVAASSPIGQVVLLVLLGFSILSCAIMLRKWRTFQKADLQSREFYDLFRKSGRLSDVFVATDRYPASPLAGVFKSGYHELNRQIQARQSIATSPEQALPGVSRPTIKSLQGIERSLQKQGAAEMSQLEGSLSWLATTATVAPFIGLFGTVVGIINAFTGLSQASGTTIQAVAPGIAEALVTTAAGLFAAIPAVIAYNQFLNRLKRFGMVIDDFDAEFLNLVERNFT